VCGDLREEKSMSAEFVMGEIADELSRVDELEFVSDDGGAVYYQNLRLKKKFPNEMIVEEVPPVGTFVTTKKGKELQDRLRQHFDEYAGGVRFGIAYKWSRTSIGERLRQALTGDLKL
jgi:hypothetical protein